MKRDHVYFGQDRARRVLGHSLRLAMVVGLVLCPGGVVGAGEGAGEGVSIRITEQPTGRHQPHELLVKFKDGVKPERIEEINAGIGATIKKEFKSIRVWHLQLPDKVEVDEAIRYYQSQPEVIYAEPNYSARINSQEKQEPSGQRPSTVPMP